MGYVNFLEGILQGTCYVLVAVFVSIIRAQEFTLQALQGSSSFKYHQFQLHPILFIRLAEFFQFFNSVFFVASVIWCVSSVLSHDKEESLSRKKVFSS